MTVSEVLHNKYLHLAIFLAFIHQTMHSLPADTHRLGRKLPTISKHYQSQPLLRNLNGVWFTNNGIITLILCSGVGTVAA